MKKIFLLIFCFIPIGLFAQVAFEMGSIKVDSIYMNESTDWWDEVTDDATFASPTNSQLPTALAVKTYVTDSVQAWIHDSISGLSTTALVSGIVHDSLANVPNYEEDPVFAADSASFITWSDTTSSIATQYDLSSVQGVVDTTGLPAQYQITYFTEANKIGGTSDVTTDVNGNLVLGEQIVMGADNTITTDLNDNFSYLTKNMSHYGLGWYTDSDYSEGKSAWLASYGAIKLFTNGLPRMTVAYNGNVGIGTTTPTTAKLTVDGTISSTGILNSLNFAQSSNEIFINNASGTKFTSLIWGDGSNDSIRINADLRVSDSVYFDLFAGDLSSVWWTGTGGGAIDTAHTVPAAFMLQMKKVQTATERLADMRGDEIRWYYQVGGKIYETFSPDKLPPMLYLQTLQAAIEHGVRNMAAIEQRQAEQEKRIAELEKQLGIKPKTKRFLFFKR